MLRQRQIVTAVFLLHAQHALHECLAGRRRKKERILGWFPGAVQAQTAGERCQTLDRDEQLRAHPGRRTHTDNLAHFELDLPNAGCRLLFGAKARTAGRDRLRLNECPASQLFVHVVTDRR